MRPCWSSSDGARRSASSSGTGDAAGGVEPKPIVDRVRADGPLLPPLTLALARWIAEHYLAPPALVIRSMLPPGLLERLELVAERTPTAADATAAGLGRGRCATCSTSSQRGPRPARDLAAPDGRAGLAPAAAGAGGREAS